ncbi:hypothetical protein LINPERPRIM_LOCUS40456 [Linum perenne]
MQLLVFALAASLADSSTVTVVPASTSCRMSTLSFVALKLFVELKPVVFV